MRDRWQVSYKAGLRSIGKSGFRVWNPDYGFCSRTRNPKTDFTSEKSVLRVDFNQEIQIRISWISFFTVRLGNPWKNLQNYSDSWTAVFFLLIMRAREIPLFFREVSDFPIERLKGNPKAYISEMKSVFGFCVRLQIRNLNFQTKFQISQSNAPLNWSKTSWSR